MKMLFTRIAFVLLLGLGCGALASGCSSSFDDCVKTRTCGVTPGAAGLAGAGGRLAAGTGGVGGNSGAGPIGRGGESAAAGAAGEATGGEAGGEGGATGEPGGCRDDNGLWQTGTSDMACGSNGNRCTACAAGQACKEGTCGCTPDSCPDGCCTTDQKCETAADTHCGRAGASCESCGDGQRCDAKAGACVCDATSCPEGCCSGDNKCLTQTNAQCGLAGASCATCGQDEHCDKSSGTCVCDASTCPNGCCDMDGRCVGYTGQSDTQCGEAGAACASCSTGQACGATGICACTADSCDGWCNGTTCEAFETIATDQPTFPATRGIVTANSDVYWASSSSTDTSANKWRIQRRIASGSASTLVSNQAPSLGCLTFGTQRLFLLNLDPQQQSIQSMKPDGSDLRTDETGALSLRYNAGRIYWHDQEPPSDGGLGGAWYDVTIKSQSESNPSDVVEYLGRVGRADADGPAEITDIAFAGTGVAFALNRLTDPGGGIDRYQIAITTSTSDATTNLANVFAPRPGRIEQLESDAGDNYYWLLKTSSSGGEDLLMQNDGDSAATSITSNLNVTDFTLFQPSSGKTFVYYAYTNPADHSTGVRLYDTSSGKTYDVVTGDTAGSLTTDDTYLYFFEANGHRLVRTPLPHVVLGLGK